MTGNDGHDSQATIYGYPRQGANRELKRAVESYWSGRSDADGLEQVASRLRLERLGELKGAGITECPSNDFSLYDHVLDTAFMLGAIPARHREAVRDTSPKRRGLETYFTMARGNDTVAPLEMTKWFDTNYHYLVPELSASSELVLDATKPLRELAEAKAAGIETRPVLLGPVSFLLLAKPADDPAFEPILLLDEVLSCYKELLFLLEEAGASWVQLDEPCLVLDQSLRVLDAVEAAYGVLASLERRPKILVASYFERLGEALPVLARSPVEGLAMDFTRRAGANLEGLASLGGIPDKRLVAGVVDGRNIWRCDLKGALSTLGTLLGLASRVDVAASCSLLHVPLDARLEPNLDPEVTAWFSFARQKLDEVVALARGLSEGPGAIKDALESAERALGSRRSSPLVRVPAVRDRVGAIVPVELGREHPYATRHLAQAERLGLPLLPLTTIGSFPQTDRVRKARAALRRGELDPAGYEEAMREEIREVVELQENLGLDVLVHGEAERNDMVQYFAEQLEGFIATENGWVQSYGSRYVRPPIILGDVSRAKAMTLSWTSYAKSLTDKPLKGMLTGPVTMLAWSFVRDDEAEADTAAQVALALRDEIADLEHAGVAVIQVDEPALREKLPLRGEDRPAYLDWAVRAFRIATSGVADATQVHTHMCYAEFRDVLGAIVEMDADVISLEAARSDMAILGDLSRSRYPNEVGPGVWDIHSPRVPSVDELTELIRRAVASFPPERLWINPDCGLKTRGYLEVRPSLEHLVEAARRVRAELKSPS